MQPNLLLLMPDQMRGDCLSLAGHPVLLTPNADELGAAGAHFRRACTTCASCIPARRSLLTGQFPARNGMVGFRDGLPIVAPTLPGCLRAAGYRTVLVGRHMHQYPYDEPYGYGETSLGSTYIEGDAYAQELERACPGLGGVRGHGISFNGWTAKPWHLPEPLHPTNWVVNRARESLAAHDPEQPLFLTASFYAPHPPFIPPAFYLERYLRQALPPAAVGEWAAVPPDDGRAAGVEAHRVRLRGEALRQAQAGYFGLINHLDDQLFWLISDFRRLAARARRPWLIVFTSDHGELLGDHHLFRKCEPYEGSSRIPFLVHGSPELGFRPGLACDQPVCLEDLMPTLLEVAGAERPPGLDGQSLVPLLRGADVRIRPWLHAEHAPCYDAPQAYHLLTDGTRKYIWRPATGTEELFDLGTDPCELRNLAVASEHKATLATWRRRLITRLEGRPEGFTDGRRLIPGRPYPAILERAPAAPA
jgi:arylsulfatase A-like enzyme